MAKSTNPTRIEVNCLTGEQTVVELTAEEIKGLADLAAKFAADQLAAEKEAEALAVAKASAQAKLASLGLTAEEIAALNG